MHETIWPVKQVIAGEHIACGDMCVIDARGTLVSRIAPAFDNIA